MGNFSIEKIRDLSISALTSSGFDNNKAKILTDIMIEADICGVHTHGIKMLPIYIDKIKQKKFNLNSISILKHTDSFTIVDASNTIGLLSAVDCTNIAIDNAKNNGIHFVLARNSNTLGPAFYYTEMMADKGLIGFVCCNAPAAMPVYNGLERKLGTNPFSFCCPSASKGNILVDMATSVVAKSKFIERKQKGLKLDNGWALDADGNPTVDPEKGINGLVLPMSGFKGYSIALIIDIISGLLTGSAYQEFVGKFYSEKGNCMNVGHLFIAIDPSILYGKDFYGAMDLYIDNLRNSKVVASKKITLPGDDRKENKEQSLKFGILVDDDIVKKLNELANSGDTK